MKQSGHAAGAFTLVEALVTVAVIAIMAAVVVPSIQQGPDAAKLTKLQQDVVIANNAIDAFLLAGGSQGSLSEGTVIEALKQRVSGSGITAEMSGSFGPFLDPRVVTNASDFAWSARFETTPRPRFVVQKSPDGIVFGKGLPSPVGGPPSAANPTWLWSYTPTTATQITKPVFQPVTSEPGTSSGGTNTIIVGLAAPQISPGSQTLGLSGFPLLVSIVNPNPPSSSIVYYRIDSSSWVLWVGSPFTVNPGASVTAVAISVDPSRYYNSPSSSATYQVIPLKLAVSVSAPTGVTYAQAGGQMAGEALMAPATVSVTLANASEIPTPYLSSSYFTVRYTLDGSDPTISTNVAPSFSGSFPTLQVPLGLSVWGTEPTVTVRAVAISAQTAWFTSSDVAEDTSSRVVTPLTLNVFPANPIGLPPQVLINESGSVPSGLRKFYTTGGTLPLSSASGGTPTPSAILYIAPVTSGLPSTSYTLTAQATGPATYESWFSSAPAVRNYNTVTTLPSEFVGANVSGGDVNGTFKGSIFVSAPANLDIFNAGGQITGGNLYVPGLPAIEIPGSGNSTKTVVGRGQSYLEQGEIPRNLIGGKEYTANGDLAVPQLDTRQVVDLNGALTPTNYTIKLTKSAYIEGKIYRRADAPPPPAVPAVPTGLTVFTNNYSGAFTNTIPAGVYSNKITMNNTNSILRLGTPGSTSEYVFSGNTWNKGRVEVLGPVVIYFLDGFDNKGVIFGNSNNIVLGSTTSLRINVMTNAIDLTGGAALYANMWGANSAVTVGNESSFYGSMFVSRLNVAPGGIVDVK